MKTRIIAATLAVATCLLPATLRAQSSAIGFSGATLSFQHHSGAGESHSSFDASADFAITAQHGFQLDVGAVDYGATWFGNIGAHLYLQPSSRARYGLFLAYADANDTEAATTEAGIEGIWSLNADTLLSARAGVGRADPSEVDYIFASLATRHALSDQLAMITALSVLDADEARSSLTAATFDLGLAWTPRAAPVELYAGASRTRISGSLYTDETRLVVGLTAHIGGARDNRPSAAQQSFAPVRPLRPLLERDMVWAFRTRR